MTLKISRSLSSSSVFFATSSAVASNPAKRPLRLLGPSSIVTSDFRFVGFDFDPEGLAIFLEAKGILLAPVGSRPKESRRA